MAKLYAELTSDKGGRVVGKGGNDEIYITVKRGNINIFDITFRPDNNGRGKLEVMNYYNGETQVIDYDPIPF